MTAALVPGDEPVGSVEIMCRKCGRRVGIVMVFAGGDFNVAGWACRRDGDLEVNRRDLMAAVAKVLARPGRRVRVRAHPSP